MARINIKKNRWKKLITILLSVVLGIGAIFGTVKLIEFSDNPSKSLMLNFDVGGLSDNGEFVETTKSLYTKDAFECQGLKVTLEFDNEINYQIYFYDAEEKFIESTELSSEVYEEALPENTKYARILIVPTKDEKVSWYEVYKYSSQLKVEVYKEQAV